MKAVVVTPGRWLQHLMGGMHLNLAERKKPPISVNFSGMRASSYTAYAACQFISRAL